MHHRWIYLSNMLSSHNEAQSSATHVKGQRDLAASLVLVQQIILLLTLSQVKLLSCTPGCHFIRYTSAV